MHYKARKGPLDINEEELDMSTRIDTGQEELRERERRQQPVIGEVGHKGHQRDG